MKSTPKKKQHQAYSPRVRSAVAKPLRAKRKQALGALRRSEERYRGLFEHMAEGYAYCQMIFENGQARDWLYLAVNEAFETLTGLKDVTGKKVSEVVPGIREADPELFNIYARVALSGQHEKFEMFVKSLEMWFSISVYSPEKGFFVAVFDVITERKRAEEALSRRAQELAALQATVLEITVPHDLSTLLRTIVQRAALLLNATGGGMYLCDPERGEVRCEVSYNTPRDYTGTVLKYGEGAAGTVAQTGQPLIIDDYRTWSGRGAVYNQGQPFTAVLSVPVIWQRRVTGVIHILNDVESRRFSQTDLELLTQFANHAAIALENARLFDAERRRVEALTALHETGIDLSAQLDLPTLLRTITQRAARLLGAPSGGLYLLLPDEQALELVVSHNLPRDYTGARLRLGEGLAGRVAQTGEPLIVGNYHEWAGRAGIYGDTSFGAVVGAPIKWQGKVLGVIDVTEVRPERFSPADVEMVSLFADQAAVAIVNSRLFEETRQRARHATLLNDITRAAVGAGDLHAMLQTLADRLHDLLDADGCSITLWDEAGQRSIRAVAYGPLRETYPTSRAEPGEVTMTESVLRAGHALVAEDVFNTPYLSPRIAAEFPARSLLGLPLISGGQKLGAALIAFNQPHHFTPDEIARGEQAAGQIALAGAQSRLFDALRASEERFRALIENASDIVAITDAEGKIRYVSPPLRRILGYAPEEILGRSMFELIHSDDLPTAIDALTYRLRNPATSPGMMEARIRHQDGSWRVFEAMGSNLLDNPAVAGIVLNMRDITERKQRERELEAIAAVSAALRAARTRAEMLPVILDQALDLLKAKGATLALREPVSGEVVVELGRGDWAGFMNVRLPPGGGLSGQVIATGQPYLSSDVLSDPRLARPDLMGNLRAAACIPLTVQEQTIGALWVGRQNEISAGEVRLLTSIADIAANAIQRETLHEQTERRLRRLTALTEIDRAIRASVELSTTLNILLEQVVNLLNVSAADVLLFNPHTLMLEYSAGKGFRSRAIEKLHARLGEGYAGRAALERRTLSVPDLRSAEAEDARTKLLTGEEFVAAFAVPLITKGKVIGVLEIFNRSPLAPDSEWLDFMQALASQAAIAIDSATLFNDLHRSNTELALAYDTTIEGWSHALDLRDKETEGHTERVTETALRLARQMGISDKELVQVRRGALLHDIGKMGVPDAILLKPGALTDDEWKIMRRHPQYAYEMLTPIAYLKSALDIPYCHHEKWDGTGYPRGLKGEQIPLTARIFAVVDVWDALRSDRPYRSAWSDDQVREYIQSETGTHFDPKVVAAFLKLTEDA